MAEDAFSGPFDCVFGRDAPLTPLRVTAWKRDDTLFRRRFARMRAASTAGNWLWVIGSPPASMGQNSLSLHGRGRILGALRLRLRSRCSLDSAQGDSWKGTVSWETLGSKPKAYGDIVVIWDPS